MFMQNGLSNANPRDNPPPKNSIASRANAAHFNGIEATVLITAAVFMGTVAGLNKSLFEELTTLFVFSRIAHLVSYLFAFHEVLSIVRSGVFTIGFIVIIRIMIMSCEAKYGYIYTMK
mmetsp:Transcript_3975/g.4985  ORF Transcript_3975/g.4985 Transcript_3975/m.4985 type:complete len:118 (+) Transcript_3975:461-814(+)